MADGDNVLPFRARTSPRTSTSPTTSAPPTTPASPPSTTTPVSSVSPLRPVNPPSFEWDEGWPPEQRLAELLAGRAAPVTYDLRIELDGSEPAIWRRVEVSCDMSLDRFHHVVQSAMGWNDSHLHGFTMGPGELDLDVQRFLTPFDLDEGDEGIAESEVRLDQVLGQPGDRLYYQYDFGDRWNHTITLEQVAAPAEADAGVRCVAGRRACPPDDTGGVSTYNELVQALNGTVRPNEWVLEKIAWLGSGFDPARFDVTSTDAAVRMAAQQPAGSPDALRYANPALVDLAERLDQMSLRLLGNLLETGWQQRTEISDVDVETAVRPYTLLLELTGDDGLELTAAGRLKPAIVERLAVDTGVTSWWIGRSNREDKTLPVSQLRTSAQGLGLLRLNKGRLVLTPAGRRVRGKPAEIWRHLVESLPLGKRLDEQHAGVLALLDACIGMRSSAVSPAAALLTAAGWRVDHQPINQRDAAAMARPTRDVLATVRGSWVLTKPGSPAVAALAHAALRPEIREPAEP